MGAKGSTTSGPKPPQDTSQRLLNKGAQAQHIEDEARQHSEQHFQSGKTSKFWFMFMDEPSKSTPREVSASAEQVRDRKFGDSNYTSVSFQQDIIHIK